MNSSFSLHWTGYHDWSAYGGSFSTSLDAPSLIELKQKVREVKKKLKKEFRRIEFGDQIEVRIRGMIPVEAITKQTVRRSRKK